ncbi:Pentatricopeptide repeat [Macleaya cordata]|uniref:Pentatricopeptide repeat n=1 Tax=Macleaya cordata TaxID=56857 RepID=A0A200PX63_MACCD|nr:Pentatricopeptide repeat [Macleaya cordata]
MFFLLRKTPLKPIQSSALFGITSRFLSSKSGHQRNHDPDEPTSASYDELITVAGRSKDFATLQHLLNKRNKDGCFNTSNTFKFVTEENPNSILDDLTETLTGLDKGFARKNAFDSLIARLCNTNHIDESQRVIAKMIQGGCGVNACTFHPLLNALTRKKKIDEAWGILTLMRENGIPIDVTAYNYILTAHCVDGNLTAAAGVLKKILEEGLKEDGRTYDAMVLGACRVGKVEGALEMLRRMEEAKIPVMYSTHAHVISGLLGLGCIAQAVEFVLAVGGRDKGLDTHNFGYLGSRLVRRKRLEEAKLVSGEMDKRGLIVGKKLRSEYESLLSAELVAD